MPEVKINITTDVGRSARDVDKLADGLDDLDDSAENAGEGIGDLEDIVKDALTLATIQQVGQFAYELGELGAQAMRTERAFEAISGGSKLAAENLAAMQRATRGAVSEMEMMQAANQLMQMGLASNAQELEEVTTMAVRLGSSMGLDATEAMESFSLLLANQSIPRLDSFGISAAKVRKRIQELQKETKGLAREEAFMVAVREEGMNSLDRLGPALEDEALQFERTTAVIEDTKAMFGELAAVALDDLLPTLHAAAETLELLFEWNDRVNEATLEHAAQVQNQSQSYQEYRNELVRSAEAAGYFVDEQGNLITAGMTSGGVVTNLIESNYLLSESEYNAAIAMQEKRAQMQQATPEAGELAGAIDEAGGAADDAAGAMDDLRDKTLKMGKAFGKGAPNIKDVWSNILETEKAAGLSSEQMGYLAERLGVADEATINAVTTMDEAIEAWDAGYISTEELALVTEDLTEAQEMLAEAEKLAGDGATQAAEEMRNAADDMITQAGKFVRIEEPVDNLAESLDTAGTGALNLATAINDIPEYKRVEVHTHYYEHHHDDDGDDGPYVPPDGGPRSVLDPESHGGPSGGGTYNLNIYTSAPYEPIIDDFAWMASGGRI